MDPNAAKPDNPNIVNPGLETPVNNISPDPLSNLQGVVDAAKEAAAAQTPEGQFATQFGGAVPPVESTPATSTLPSAESAPDLMGQALANLDTAPPAPPAGKTLEQTQPVVETPAEPAPEQTPGEKLKQQVSDAVNAFLEETQEKAAA